MPGPNNAFDLVASDAAERSEVFGLEGEKLGTIERLMIDRRSGQVEYALLKLEDQTDATPQLYPIPWLALEYDEDQAGYVLDVNLEFLESAPSFSSDDVPEFSEEYIREVDAAYDIEHHEHPPHPPLANAAEFVRHNPLGAVLGAVIVGVVLGRLGLL